MVQTVKQSGLIGDKAYRIKDVRLDNGDVFSIATYRSGEAFVYEIFSFDAKADGYPTREDAESAAVMAAGRLLQKS